MVAKKKTTESQGYTADSMRELTGLEPIRQSPSQYIGDTLAVSAKNGRNNPDPDEKLTAGGFHLFVETLGNASDEATNSGPDGKPYADLIEIRLHEDQSITITDNGRGVPPDVNKATGKSGLEITYLTMNAGGKFKSRTEKKAGNYKTAQGLHGVGAACVAALSDRLDVTVWRNGKEYKMSAKEGIPGSFADNKIRSKFTPSSDHSKVVTEENDSRPKQLKDEFPHGTSVHWHPDPKIWGGTDIPWRDIMEYVDAQSYMAPNCTYRIIDETSIGNGTKSKPKITEFHHPGGINDMIEEKTEKTTNLSPTISFDVDTSYMKDVVIEKDDGTMGTEEISYACTVKVALRWTTRTGADIEGYANGVHCTGKHVDGFRRGISRGVGDWIKSAGVMTKQDEKKGIVPNIDDITDGMIAVVEVLLEDQCDFHGQTKDVLGNSEVLSCVSDAVKDQITAWLKTKKNASTAKKVAKSIIESARLRAKQKEERETAKKIKEKSGGLAGKPAKLCDCKLEGPGTEILVAEGDSAGGTIRQARNATTQAVFPIRGVSANAYGATDAKILANKEFNDFVNAMRGGGIGKNFDYEHRRYDRIGIYTDADEDGNNIRCLLLVFIYLYMPGMIENGKVFAGCPPLYSIVYKNGPKKGTTEYAANEAERDKFVDKFVKEGGNVKDLVISRSKGLGEMSTKEFEPCLNPKTRKVRVITVDDVAEARESTKNALELLFSSKKDSIDERRKWIDETFETEDEADASIIAQNVRTVKPKRADLPKNEKERNWATFFADGGMDIVQLDTEVLNSMRSYIDYTLTDRALSYIDGMKPVHRAILWYMWDHNIKSGSTYVKSMSIAGGIIATLHAHSGDATYLAAAGLTRANADDSRCGACTLNTSLVDGHGNFGSSFEDSPASSRYTEMRLSKAGEACVRDTSSSAVFMNLSFDTKSKLPELLPSRLPLLLINGSKGLAYGYNVSWLPHNPREALQACIERIDNPKCTVADIRKIMPGPDFPSGGVLVDRDDSGLKSAYETGFGNMTLTSRYTIMSASRGRHMIQFYETPYRIARSGDKSIISGISNFAEKHPEYGITDVKNLSSKDNDCLIEVSVKSGINADLVAHALLAPNAGTMLTQTLSYRQSAVIGAFERTDMPDATGRTGMFRLTNPKPRDVDMLAYIDFFLDFRKSCVYNACEYERDKALKQKHLIDGMLIALIDIDKVIEIVRRSQNKDTAKKNLMKHFKLDNEQADYILAIPLSRLTRSDKISLEGNSKNLAAKAKELSKIISSDKNVMKEIKRQLEEELEKQTLPRRTDIISSKFKHIAKAKGENAEAARAMIAIAKAACGDASETIATVNGKASSASGSGLTVSGTATICLSSTGEACYVQEQEGKKTKLPQLPVQTITGADLNGTILVVFNNGESTRLPARELPADKYGKMQHPVVGLAYFGTDESAISNVALIASSGKVKILDSNTLTKTAECPVMKLGAGEKLLAARPVDTKSKTQCFAFVTNKGNILRFPLSAVNKQGRTSSGVAGLKLASGAKLLYATISDKDADILVTCDGASIKLSKLSAYPEKGRGTLGVSCHKFAGGASSLTAAYIGANPAAHSGKTSIKLPQIVMRDGKPTVMDGLDGITFGEKQ